MFIFYSKSLTENTMSLIYYEILGVSKAAGIQQIKFAYRRLAKKFHPDISKDPDAHEKFILVNEAYEFLTELKLKEIRTSQNTSQTPPTEEIYRQWLKRERMKARARAAQEARRKFNEFRESPIYKTTQIIFTFYDILSIIIGFLILLAIVAGILISADSPEGITASDIVAFIFLCFLGLMFILFSIASIRARYRKV